MQIKRIEAKNMTEALKQIKRELGPDAVILSAKDIKKENRLLGITRTCGVEVTAAVDVLDTEPAEPSRERLPGNGPSDSGPMTGEANGQNRLVHRIQDVVRIGSTNPRPQKISPPAVEPSVQHPSLLSDLLSRSGLNSKWTDRLLRASSEAIGDAELGDAETVAAGLKRLGLATRPVPQKTGKSIVIALVGPSGVGKTTALAKLAAFYKYRMHQTVGLVSLDESRLGTAAQLAVYARILGVSMEQASFRSRLPEVVSRLKSCEVVLLDTPESSPKDAERIRALGESLSTVNHLHTLLVMSAVTRQKDLEQIVEAFSGLPLHSAVVTKLDETDQIGDLIPVLIRRRLPVSFLGSGPRVPMDFEEATLVRWAERILGMGGGRPDHSLADIVRHLEPETISKPQMRYVANRSSDIFHQSDCRWIRFINEANVVEFDSYTDAVNHRFNPCRYCNPKDHQAGIHSKNTPAAPVGRTRIGSYR